MSQRTSHHRKPERRAPGFRHIRHVSLPRNSEASVAQNNGTININRGQSQEALPSDAPIFTAPRNNGSFVVRNNILGPLRSRLLPSRSRAVLVGPVGTGNSRIARFICNEIRRQRRNLDVWWVDARSYDTFVDSYRNIARHVHLPGWQDRSLDVLEPVHHWLANTDRNWLMVVDDADELALFRGDNRRAFVERNGRQTPASLRRYIPLRTRGTILVTSRDRAVAREMAEAEEIFEVGNMTVQEAMRLLDVRHRRHDGRGYYYELVTRLECNPLAICQAAAYIESNQVTLSNYLDAFKRMDGNTLSLLSTEPSQCDGDPRAPRAILKAWKRSIEQSEADYSCSVDGLEVMNHFDWRSDVPQILVRASLEIFNPGNELRLNNAARRMEDRFLINRRPEGPSHDMYIFVRLAVRERLLKSKQSTERRIDAVCVLSTVFPDEQSSDLALASSCYPHVAAVLGIASERDVLAGQPLCQFEPQECRMEWALLLQNISWYLESTERPGLAECAARKAISLLYPWAKPESVWCLSNLAKRLHRRGKFDEAQRFARDALRAARSEFGANHPATLRCTQELLDISEVPRRLSKSRRQGRTRPAYASTPTAPQPAHLRGRQDRPLPGPTIVFSAQHNLPRFAPPTQTNPSANERWDSNSTLDTFENDNYVPSQDDSSEYSQNEKMEYSTRNYVRKRRRGEAVTHFNVWYDGLGCADCTDWIFGRKAPQI